MYICTYIQVLVRTWSLGQYGPNTLLLRSITYIRMYVRHSGLMSVSRPMSSKRMCVYSEISLIRHSMGPENNVGLGGCWIMECLSPYLGMDRVPHVMIIEVSD